MDLMKMFVFYLILIFSCTIVMASDDVSADGVFNDSIDENDLNLYVNENNNYENFIEEDIPENNFEDGFENSEVIELN